MPKPSFYNDNAFRDYPLISPAAGELAGTIANISVPWPTSWLLDFCSLVGPEAQYQDDVDTIYLAALSLAGNVLTFRVRSTAALLSGYELVFTRNVADAAVITETVMATPIVAMANPFPDCPDIFIWDGVLTTGSLIDVATFLPFGGAFIGGPQLQFEPALIQNLRAAILRSINLANTDRTRVTPPEGCPGPVPSDTPPTYVMTTCIAGDIRFRPGYNCVIQQDNTRNSLQFGAAVGSGAGQPCGEVPVYPAEAPGSATQLLTGGPECRDLLKTINGVGGPVIYLQAGTGILIEKDLVNPHTLTVSADLHNLITCPQL